MLSDLTKEAISKLRDEQKLKEAFYVTDNSKCRRELYYGLTNEPVTNFNSYESIMRMNMGKTAEKEIIEVWKKLGIFVEEQVRVDEEIQGQWRIHGYLDAIVKINDVLYPVEVKSFYGYYQAKDLKEGIANESYVKQLGLYIHYLSPKYPNMAKTGVLYYIDRADATTFEFLVTLEDNGDIKCNGRLYGNIADIQERLKSVIPSLEKQETPKPDYEYKYSIDMMATTKLGIAEKKKILSGGKVWGDFWCKYCSYLDKCLRDQGVERGYTDEEMEQIKNILG